MKNPWKEKFSVPLMQISEIDNYCLDSEIELIKEFNETQSTEYKIHTDIYPAAFSANIDEAEIIILVSNPGYDRKEAERGDYKDFYRIKNNLEILTRERKNDSFSVDYWTQKLNKLIEIYTSEKVNTKVAILEYFPYHSEKFKPIGKRLMEKHFPNEKYLPSQKYTFYKLQQVIERSAILICTRSQNLWIEVLKSLDFNFSEGHFLTTINKRNPTISVGNLTNGEKDWGLITSKFN